MKDTIGHCRAGRSRGFLAGARAGADLKFDLEPEPIFLGRLQLLFWQVKNEMNLRFSIFFS